MAKKKGNGKGKKPSSVETFRILYPDYASARGIKVELTTGKRTLDDMDIYTAISQAGERIDPDLTGVELTRPAMNGILNAWYSNSRTQVVDFITKPTNLDEVVAKTFATRMNAGGILGAEYKDEKLKLVTIPLRAPGNTKGYEAIASSHERFYNLANALRDPENVDRQTIAKEIQSGIQKTLKESGVSNPDEWANIFGYIASINSMYATRKAQKMLVDAYKDFEKYDGLAGKSKRDYFGRIASETLTAKRMSRDNDNPAELAEGERAMELLYSYTVKPEKKAKKK